MNSVDTDLRRALADVQPSADALEQTMRRVERLRRRHARRRATAMGLVLTALAAAAIVIALDGAGPAAARPVEVPGRIVAVAGTSTRIWAITCTARCDDPQRRVGRLVTIDAATGRIERAAEVRAPQALGAGATGVWAADFAPGSVTRFDAATGRRAATIRLRLPRPVTGRDASFVPSELAVGEGAVWVSSARGYIARIDPASDRVTAMIRTVADASGPLAAGEGAVWIGEGRRLGRIDPVTNTVTRVAVRGTNGRRLVIGAVAIAGGSVWVGGEWARPDRNAAEARAYTSTGEAALAEIEPRTGTVRSVTALPRGATLRSSRGSSLWLSNASRGEIDEFDVRARRVVARARVTTPGEIVPVHGRVWVASSAHRLTPVTLAR